MSGRKGTKEENEEEQEGGEEGKEMTKGREGGRKEGSKGEKEGERVITVFMISPNLDTPTHTMHKQALLQKEWFYSCVRLAHTKLNQFANLGTEIPSL